MLFPSSAASSLLLSLSLIPSFVLGHSGSIGKRRGVTSQRRASVCNGHSELCDKSYGEVSFIGAHDSYAVGTTNIAANQDANVTAQLTDGIRLLQIQAHNASGTLRLCHSSCLLLDAGTLESYLSSVNTWAVANPNEVFSILIVNSDNVEASKFAEAFVSSGLDQIAYSPSKATLSNTEWPTLGTMIDDGKRVVVFMDHQADFTTVPYIIDEFANVFEDAYNVLEPSFPCTANRSSGDPSSQLMLTNHYLDTSASSAGTVIPVPYKAQLNVTNAVSGAGSLGVGASTCQTIWGRQPNFMLVDFYTSTAGQVFEVAATLNNVSAPTNTISPYLAGTSTSSSGSSTTSTTSESLSAGSRTTGGVSPALVLSVVSSMSLAALGLLL